MEKIRATIAEYPRNFWILIGSLFIDRLGGALIFPFFSLYITEKFGVGMTQVGTLFAFYAVSSFFGSLIGGALTDRFGRRSLMIFGLISSATSALIMGLSKDFHTFFYFLGDCWRFCRHGASCRAGYDYRYPSRSPNELRDSASCVWLPTWQ